MARFMKWLKDKLGIMALESRLLEENASLQRRIHYLEGVYKNLASIGVDVHFKEPHMIVIYSHLGGGQIRHIPAYFNNLTELNEYCRRLRKEFNTERIIFDLPHGCPKFFD